MQVHMQYSVVVHGIKISSTLSMHLLPNALFEITPCISHEYIYYPLIYGDLIKSTYHAPIHILYPIMVSYICGYLF